MAWIGTGWKGTGRDRTERDCTACRGTGCGGEGRDGMGHGEGRDGMQRDGTGWRGTGRDGEGQDDVWILSRPFHAVPSLSIQSSLFPSCPVPLHHVPSATRLEMYMYHSDTLAQPAAQQARTPASEQSTNHIFYFLYDVYVLVCPRPYIVVCLVIQVCISALIVLCCLATASVSLLLAQI